MYGYFIPCIVFFIGILYFRKPFTFATNTFIIETKSFVNSSFGVSSSKLYELVATIKDCVASLLIIFVIIMIENKND